MPTRAAVFLDRDGVLNRARVSAEGTPLPPTSASTLEILPGAAEACAQLRTAGYVLIVATNQPDVARGSTTIAAVEAINERLRESIPVDDFAVCYHDDADCCPCRKPRPGLLLEAASTWGLELSESVMVGDRWRDIEAGRNAGCKTVFVDHGYAERKPEAPSATFSSLAESVPWILAQSSPL